MPAMVSFRQHALLQQHKDSALLVWLRCVQGLLFDAADRGLGYNTERS